MSHDTPDPLGRVDDPDGRPRSSTTEEPRTGR